MGQKVLEHHPEAIKRLQTKLLTESIAEIDAWRVLGEAELSAYFWVSDLQELKSMWDQP